MESGFSVLSDVAKQSKPDGLHDKQLFSNKQ